MSAFWHTPIIERDLAEAEYNYLQWHKMPEAVALLDRLQMAPDDMWPDIASDLEGCRDDARDTFVRCLGEYDDALLDIADEQALSVEEAIDRAMGVA
jgi:hypothetical protein